MTEISFRKFLEEDAVSADRKKRIEIDPETGKKKNTTQVVRCVVFDTPARKKIRQMAKEKEAEKAEKELEASREEKAEKAKQKEKAEKLKSVEAAKIKNVNIRLGKKA